ncbi:hypothetical protein JAAARDRAFT_561428 [Jaapia argillacea MUCL 33604]|uniref:Uncharacterized protein n=1 Tax=Jaapia argillacea MUCL 33604 TaxID=933084 RepID=A0A067Q3P8_9AGAM|nr:hypothetical protein JAAARDRAFT_561428 [Jaapia argillacea MUCL 33604]
MPSLRRTISSPSLSRSARSAPYPSLGLTGANRVNGHVPRRTSGSETSTRRVLADIDWWKVMDGQRDLDQECSADDQQEVDVNSVDDVPVASPTDLQTRFGIDHLSSGIGAGVPLSPLTLTVGIETARSDELMPVAQFAALSISPITPGSAGHSASSSTESSPELPCAQLFAPSVDSVGIYLTSSMGGLPPMTVAPFPSLPRNRPRPNPLSGLRAFSLNDLDYASAGRFSDAAILTPSVTHFRAMDSGLVDVFN